MACGALTFCPRHRCGSFLNLIQTPTLILRASERARDRQTDRERERQRQRSRDRERERQRESLWKCCAKQLYPYVCSTKTWAETSVLFHKTLVVIEELGGHMVVVRKQSWYWI